MTHDNFPDDGNRPKDEELIRELIEGIDASILGDKLPDQYPLIPGDDIVTADENDPLMGVIMKAANEALTQASLQANGEMTRLPELHNEGWTITISTDAGPVRLWSCWLGDRFELSYPGKPIANHVIRELLEVDYFYLEGVNYGKFSSPRLETGGRVWIEIGGHDDAATYSSISHSINDDGIVEKVTNLANTIRTFPFSFFSQGVPDFPSAEREEIQNYKEKFVLLAAEIAFHLGNPTGVSTQFAQLVVTPEDLRREGYNVQQVNGKEGERRGWGQELVMAQKAGEKIALESANSLVPWVATRRIDVDDSVKTPYALARRILSEDLYF